MILILYPTMRFIHCVRIVKVAYGLVLTLVGVNYYPRFYTYFEKYYPKGTDKWFAWETGT